MTTTFREIASIRFHELATHRSVWNKYKLLNRSQWMDRADLEDLQLAKLRRLLIHAQEEVPFYRERFESVGFQPKKFESFSQLEEIPPLTKNDLRTNYSALLAGNHNFKYGFKDATGGSTGGPVQYYVGRNSAAFRTARDIRFRKWYGFSLGQKKALVWGAQQDLTTGHFIISKIKRRLKNVLELNAWTLKPALMTRFIEDIKRFKPRLIEAYARALLVLIDFALANGLADGLQIPTVISAEMISQEERGRIESVVGHVTNRYGSREFGAVAQECEVHDGMHIAAESLYLESVGLHDTPSVLLITNLDNYAMPFIRYECGDRAKLSESSCRCGRKLPRISEFGGRTSDLIRTPDGNIVSGLVFWHELRLFDFIEDFQIVQDDLNRITLLLVTRRDLTKEDRSSLLRGLKPVLGSSMNIDLQPVEKIPRSASGKMLIVKSSL